MLIDGARLGFGRLLEPIDDEGTVTPPPTMRSSHAAPSAAVAVYAPVPDVSDGPQHTTTRKTSLAALMRQAKLPDDYAARLVSASDGAIQDTAAPLLLSADELAAACRRAKLPVGHRLGLLNTLRLERV
jgi:hypothetical protein